MMFFGDFTQQMPALLQAHDFGMGKQRFCGVQWFRLSTQEKKRTVKMGHVCKQAALQALGCMTGVQVCCCVRLNQLTLTATWPLCGGGNLRDCWGGSGTKQSFLNTVFEEQWQQAIGGQCPVLGVIWIGKGGQSH
jgi:hypothetical protein